MACRMTLDDDDTSMARTTTNNLVTDAASHDGFCNVCDDCHIYHQVLFSVRVNLVSF